MTVNIPWTALAPPAPHAGLLYAPGTDWANWAMIAIVPWLSGASCRGS